MSPLAAVCRWRDDRRALRRWRRGPGRRPNRSDMERWAAFQAQGKLPRVERRRLL